jgi:hypothetical protein
MRYIIDSNIWVDLDQGKISCGDLTATPGVVVAPFMIIELVRATVKGGEKHFAAKKAMFECMSKFPILELTKIFMFKKLWNIDGASVSGVRPHTYTLLLKMLLESGSLREFLGRTEQPGSVWQRIAELDSIHEGVLDKELRALDKLADGASLRTLHVHMARLYALGGLIPDPDTIEHTFSAALEFLRSAASKIRRGANLFKNDRGLYIDHQLLFYLADADVRLVTNENFQAEIGQSPQRHRIMTFDAFSHLGSSKSDSGS